MRHEAIRLVIGERVLTAVLDDCITASDFAALLPLSLHLSDYAAAEMISDLPRQLSTAGASEGYTPRMGDLAYYAPWGNLAIFYKDFRYSKGLVRLGRITAGLETLGDPGNVAVRIER